MKRRKNCGGSDRSAFNGAVLLATSLANSLALPVARANDLAFGRPLFLAR
jgi:hypothetical protein